MGDRDHCVVCQPDDALVRAGNSYYTCGPCRRVKTEQPSDGHKCGKKQAVLTGGHDGQLNILSGGGQPRDATRR